jgi:hypothetical protein
MKISNLNGEDSSDTCVINYILPSFFTNFYLFTLAYTYESAELLENTISEYFYF